MLMKYHSKNLKPLLSDKTDRISGLCSVLHNNNELVYGCLPQRILGSESDNQYFSEE